MSLDTIPDTICDDAGYPTDAFINWLTNETDATAALTAAASYFNASGCGRAWIESEELKMATRGWSGCEEVIRTLSQNLYVTQRWLSHHRGGLWVYEATGVELTGDTPE